MNSFRKNLLLYAITDSLHTDIFSLIKKAEDALKGGITCIQLREKNLPYNEFLAEATQLKKLCKKYSVPLIINDNVNIAIKSGADGVHVGQSDMDIADVRKLVGDKMIIGATAKTIEQAVAAQEKGADYLGVGAVFPTSTKPDAKRITIDKLQKIANSVTIPIVAIGGICEKNISQLKGCNIAGVALSSGVFSEDDIIETCRKLLYETKKVTL